jgi:hypothetical protein
MGETGNWTNAQSFKTRDSQSFNIPILAQQWRFSGEIECGSSGAQLLLHADTPTCAERQLGRSGADFRHGRKGRRGCPEQASRPACTQPVENVADKH